MASQIKRLPGMILGLLAAVCMFFCAEPRIYAAETAGTRTVLVKGLEAYKKGDWNTAVFLLRQCILLKENSSPEVLYILIMSEMHDGEYTDASAHCDLFLSLYPDSSYRSYVEYQRGRTSYYNGDYNRAVLLLSDFCHEYPEHEMYASALYWIAEAFYAGYNYDPAKALFERIVTDFPLDAKAAEAQYRIEAIDQRHREEKLIYLLRMTGEEYLSAKEEYEKQLKEYKTEGLVGLQRQLKEEQDKNAAAAAALEDQKHKNAELQSTIDALHSAAVSAPAAAAPESSLGNNSDLLELKRKAREIQSLMTSHAEE